MSTFIERLEIEKSELGEKIIKLKDFFVSGNFEKINVEQQGLLTLQVTYMEHYHSILEERLRLLNK